MKPKIIFITILGLLLVCMNGCSNSIEMNFNDESSVPEQGNDMAVYYSECIQILQTAEYGALVRGSNEDSGDQSNIYSKYAPYADKFENILTLPADSVSNICQEAPFIELCTSFDSILEDNYPMIYQNIDIASYRIVYKIVEQYLRNGGHSPELLTELSKNISEPKVRKLISYSGATLDNYIEQQTIQNFPLEKAIEQSCEDILLAKLAIVGVDVGTSLLFSLMLPPSVIGSILTTTYGLVTVLVIVDDYNQCVRARDNANKNKP